MKRSEVLKQFDGMLADAQTIVEIEAKKLGWDGKEDLASFLERLNQSKRAK